MLSAFDSQLLLPIAYISIDWFFMRHETRELGAEDPLILYDKKEKNPQSESRRYWSDILQLPQQVDSIGSQQ
jgi:hypothetical protein